MMRSLAEDELVSIYTCMLVSQNVIQAWRTATVVSMHGAAQL